MSYHVPSYDMQVAWSLCSGVAAEPLVWHDVKHLVYLVSAFSHRSGDLATEGKQAQQSLRNCDRPTGPVYIRQSDGIKGVLSLE